MMIDGYQVVDAHMHYTGIFKGERTFIEYMDENGIDSAIVNTLNKRANLGDFSRGSPADLVKKTMNPGFQIFEDFTHGQPDHGHLEQLAQECDRIIPFFWYNPVDPDDPKKEGLDEVKKALDAGFKGVKIQLAMTPCSIEDLYPLAGILENMDHVPLYIHPSAGLYGAGRTNPVDIASLCKKFPKLNIILGHAAYTMEFCIEVIIASFGVTNLFFETSVSIPYGIISLLKFFGHRRVIFGSDSPAATPFEVEYAKISALNISNRARKAILCGNIRRLLGLKKE
ncbi:amidohydrolase family protein [Candidatus Bathyarchaeota archaeon]|nr:amidohydrolase family protein [Candidatus Bathyarchaeota archaeon]